MELSGRGHVKKGVGGSLLLWVLWVTVVGGSLPAFRMTAAASPATVVAVDPPVVGANPGAYFTLSFNVTDVTDLYAYGFRLKWPIGLLEIDAENITEGPFLKQGGATGLAKKNYTDYIDVGCTLLGAESGVSGNGILVTATFRVLTTGKASLDLYSVTLLDSTLGVIGDWEYKDSPDDGYFSTFPVAQFSYTPHPAQYPWRPIVNETISFNATASYTSNDPPVSSPDGILSYRWDFGDGNITTVSSPIITHAYKQAGLYPVTLKVTDNQGRSNVDVQTMLVQLHDVVLYNIAVAQTEIHASSMITINVTILNKGSVPEHFTVTAYYNATPIEAAASIGLGIDKETTIALSWDTTGVAGGDYQISAEATHVDGESNPQDNVLVDGTVTVTSSAPLFPTTLIIGVAAVTVAALTLIAVYYKKTRNTREICAALR